MMIATVTAPGRGATDRLLGSVAAALAAEGRRPAGVIRATGAGPAGDCEAALRVLPDGPVIRITQDLGPDSGACRLDAGALEEAVGALEAVLARPADLMIVNKFGQREAEGRGFRPLIGEALSRGMPVLVGLAAPHRAAFDAFAEGAAETLTPEPEVVLAWCRAAIDAVPA